MFIPVTEMYWGIALHINYTKLLEKCIILHIYVYLVDLWARRVL